MNNKSPCFPEKEADVLGCFGPVCVAFLDSLGMLGISDHIGNKV